MCQIEVRLPRCFALKYQITFVLATFSEWVLNEILKSAEACIVEPYKQI